MLSLTACFLLLLTRLFLVSAAPATPSASAAGISSFIQLDANATSSLNLPSSFCSRPNSPNTDIQTYKINVPGTTTILTIFYCDALQLNPELIYRTLIDARIHMSDKLNRFGNRPLLPEDDPYISPVVPGLDCTLRISSQRVGTTQVIRNHLTYVVTMNALRGLFQFLYEEGHAGSAVTEVADPGLAGSMMGIGVISISPLEKPGV